MKKNKNTDYIGKQKVLSIIREIDRDLEGFQRKVKMYCVGGTYLALTRDNRLSKDLDFILSREDFRALSGIVAEIERRDDLVIDLFPDGELPNFKLPDYAAGSKRLLSLEHIDVYDVDLLNFVLTKAIAGRDDDLNDVRDFFKDKPFVPKEKLIERFNEIKISKGKEEEVKRKFWSFVEEFYKK